MRSFGWNPKDEEVKDMVNVIDQVFVILSMQCVQRIYEKLSGILYYSMTLAIIVLPLSMITLSEGPK